MRRLFTIVYVLLSCISLMAQERACDARPMMGQDTVSAAFFRNTYHSGDLVHYLESYNDFAIYEGGYTGRWADGDQLIFAVNGNPYRMNKYYMDGFRIDNRFQVGSTNYVPNMQSYDMVMDTHNSHINFTLDPEAGDYAEVTGNVGGLGGVFPGTNKIVHITHRTGWEGAYKKDVSLNNRQHTVGAGSVDAAYSFADKDGNKYRQHVYVTFGRRKLPKYDGDGLIEGDALFGANYYKVQFDGQLPVKPNALFDKVGYLLNFSGKQDGNSEFYYNWEEMARLNTYSVSLYGKRKYLTTGLTWASNVVRHKNLQFERNIVDQDGMSFDPWQADGNYHDLNWAVNYNCPLNSWLTLKADCYNSMVRFSPSTETFSNNIFHMLATPRPEHFPEGDYVPVSSTPEYLYRYDWQSRAFWGGIIENTFGVEVNKRLSKAVDMRANLGLTVDGMLLGHGKSKVSPNVQAGVSFDIHPWKWLQLGVNLKHDRMSYTMDELLYFSNDYMNANIHYAGSGRLFGTTGGKYHSYKKGLMQPSYFTLDIPVKLRFGRHEIALLQTYRKYVNVWMTRFDGGMNDYLYRDGLYYFQHDGVKNYEVGALPTSFMGNGFLNNTPYYMSQLTRYTYYGKRSTFSLSWQSMQAVGLSALGHGPKANTVGALAESQANPNSFMAEGRENVALAGVGRHDHDKGYVCRIFYSYNFNRFFQAGITAKWTDGWPFTTYKSARAVNQTGDVQYAVIPVRTKGDNPIDGDFGSRMNAIYQIDLHARVQWTVKKCPMSVTLQCYNIIDFGPSYVEYAFNEGLNDNRCDMFLSVPRGLLVTYRVGL